MNVSFVDVSIEVTEGVGIVDFMLQKTAGAVGPVSVQIFTSDGTALGMMVMHVLCSVCIATKTLHASFFAS